MARKSTLLENGSWYKGNTHLHTTYSDGKLSPEDAVAVYRQADYDFVAVTDHWHYGGYPELETDGFIIFPGMEMDVGLPREQGHCHHVTAMAAPADTPYRMGDRLEEVRALGDMNAMIKTMNESGHLCIYAHPAWSHVQMDAYERIEGCAGVEVYNHVCEMGHGCGYSETYFESKLWTGKPFLAFASDDAHQRQHYIGGFIKVKAKALTHKDVLDAIRQGSFYASTGPEISDFYVEDGKAHLECSPCGDIAFFSDFTHGKMVVWDQPGTTRASWDIPPDKSGCVYAMCRDKYGKAWTQPIWL